MTFAPLLRIAVTVAAVVLAGTGAVSPARADALQDVLDGYVEEEELPGGLLLFSDPRHRQLVVAGVANRRNSAPVTPDSRFYVASVGKMTVAAATLQLVEEGRLSLDAPVAPLVAHLPGLAKLANLRSARLGQLLDHSSGIPDYLTDAFESDSRADAKRRWTAAEVLSYAVGERATNRPGQSHEYSNSNFVLLGEIIATADGTTLAEVLQRRIFDRAGMTRTTVGVTNPNDPALVRGYADIAENGRLQDVSLLSWNFPFGDGPLVTTAGDMERFLFALFRDGKLLQPATLAQMVAPSGQEAEYGLGTERGKDKWGRWFGHTGTFDGFDAEVRYYPEHKAALVFMANGNTSSDTSVIKQAAGAVFRGRKPGN